VSVFDTGSDGAVHFIVMEFVEGQTLAEVMASDGPLEPGRAADIARSIAEALSFAHAEGLVHRDVKPANVMITPAGRVKVMDFGIARLTSSVTITQTATVFGTAAYLAPEQAQGERVDGRADVYALGVVLYEMLAGRVPFVADSAVAVASKHVFQRPEPPSTLRRDVPPELEAVAMRALEKDPAMRYAGAAEMAAAIDAATGGPGVATVPFAGPTAPPDRTAVLPPVRRAAHSAPRRGPRWWIPIVVFLLGALLLAAFLPPLLSGKEPTTPTTPRHPAGKHTHTASVAPPTPATSAPPTTAPPTTAPPTTPATTAPSPLPPPVTSVSDAAAAVASALQSAATAGAIDDHAAKEAEHGLDDSVRRYEDGDLEGALEQISQAQRRLDDSVGNGDTSEDAGAVISAAFDQLAQAMQASPPDPGNSGGHGDKGKGHDDEGHGND
jgi:serine/threonine-protein kinase